MFLVYITSTLIALFAWFYSFASWSTHPSHQRVGALARRARQAQPPQGLRRLQAPLEDGAQVGPGEGGLGEAVAPKTEEKNRLNKKNEKNRKNLEEPRFFIPPNMVLGRKS